MGKSIFDFQFGIFDCDGTLINSMPFYTRVFVEVLKEKTGIPKKYGRKFYKETAGTPVLKQYEEVLRINNKLADPKEMAELFFERFNREKEGMRFKVFPGAMDLLKKLSVQGIKLFITSGSRLNDLAEKLNNNDLLAFFELIMGSDEIPKGIEHIKIFATRCNLPLEEFAQKAFLVGDGPTDMRIAKEARIYAIGVDTTVEAKLLIGAGADRVIKNIKDLGKEGN